jgi:hypothetical protein
MVSLSTASKTPGELHERASAVVAATQRDLEKHKLHAAELLSLAILENQSPGETMGHLLEIAAMRAQMFNAEAQFENRLSADLAHYPLVEAARSSFASLKGTLVQAEERLVQAKTASVRAERY